MTRHLVFFCHYSFRHFPAQSGKPIILLLVMLWSCQVLSQAPSYQQYSESACLLIADQVERFKQQPQLPSYQNALKNYRRHCQQPVAQQPKPNFDQSVPGAPPATTKTPTPPVVIAPPVTPINQAVPLIQVATDGLLAQLMWLLLILFAILAFRLLFKGAWGRSRNAWSRSRAAACKTAGKATASGL